MSDSTTDPTRTVDIEAQAQALAAASGVSIDEVRKLLHTQDQQTGEAVKTIRFDPVSGAVAHRVMDGDVVKWRVSHPTDGMHYEMTPTKADWQQLA